MNITDCALSTMAYFILRLAYVDAIEEEFPCSSSLQFTCDPFDVYEDVVGEVEIFLESLDTEGETDARRRFFELFAEELSSGIYLDSERIADACPPGVDSRERFRNKLLNLVRNNVRTSETIQQFIDTLDVAIVARK